MKCPTKGCVFETLPGQSHCRNHLERPELPIAPKPSPDVEIVRLDSVPQFKIQNKRAYDPALAAKALSADNALKIKLTSEKEATPLAVSIKNYATKMGVTLKHRTGPNCIWIFKAPAKPAALKRAAS